MGCAEEVDPVSSLEFFATNSVVRLNAVDVSKANRLPLYMHYMPWFEAPNDTTPNFGYHWTMRNRDPFEIDPATGQREISSHYYPLIGPYHSADPDVIRYHLLLMKYAGVDAILIDWYGIEGGNDDIEMLLNNSNAIIPFLDEVGLSFAIVLEDRFSRSPADVRANMEYIEDHYYDNIRYLKKNGRPYVLIFGPLEVKDESEWTTIVGATDANEIMLPLWGQSGAESVADGQYAWPVEQGLPAIEQFYRTANLDAEIGGVAYPGFEDFYLEGLGEDIIGWELPVSPETFQSTLDAAMANLGALDFLQVATWNDFGEGTIVEPTVQNGFTFLEQLQEFAVVSRFGPNELRLVHEWYTYTKDESLDNNLEAQNIILQTYYYLVSLNTDAARGELIKLEELAN